MQFKLDLLEEEAKLLDKKISLKLEKTKLKAENTMLMAKIVKLEQTVKEKDDLMVRIVKLEHKLISKKNLSSSFLNGLELDVFFQKYQIALEVQGVQHWLYHTSWYKDIKKLEDIVNHDWLKKCICQDNRIFLIEIWYDKKPEIVISKRIQKIKEFTNQLIKSLDDL
ncbi:hypothetical protein Glove_810674g3 [Diversispora epigaea]|uniref:Uncharacterized protein n=1 Tax=Diversispora epigaea TaxID=1348612 RepID=A0A397FX04_9GLOM|nr:hypothetical protein Glove_810674g3 [Diversispora epigaea]